LFDQALDGKVMVVDVKLGVESLEASAPRELFALPPQSGFEVARTVIAYLEESPIQPLAR
jgi:hypothetical protein